MNFFDTLQKGLYIYILKNVGKKIVLATIDFHCMDQKKEDISKCSTEESYTV